MTFAPQLNILMILRDYGKGVVYVWLRFWGCLLFFFFFFFLSRFGTIGVIMGLSTSSYDKVGGWG